MTFLREASVGVEASPWQAAAGQEVRPWTLKDLGASSLSSLMCGAALRSDPQMDLWQQEGSRSGVSCHHLGRLPQAFKGRHWPIYTV